MTDQREVSRPRTAAATAAAARGAARRRAEWLAGRGYLCFAPDEVLSVECEDLPGPPGAVRMRITVVRVDREPVGAGSRP